MSDDSRDLDAAMAILRTFGENLTEALKHIHSIRQAHLATFHTVLALASSLKGTLDFALLSENLHKMQKALESEAWTADAQKHLTDLASVFQSFAPQPSNPDSSKTHTDHEDRLRTFLRGWNSETRH